MKTHTPKSLEELENERFEWSLKTFPEATIGSSILKAQEEIHEVLKSFRDGETKEQTAEEYADIVKAIFDSAGRAGITVHDIRNAFEKKLAKNKARTWVKNADNTYSHVK